ncbi:MAG: hypothetical protein PHU14_09245, partial [Methylovulum sp.]|nr:hypothetical protein [Methylovulum sp.]
MKKLNKIFNCSALAVAAMTLWAGSAQATSINFLNTSGGLYSTGVDGSGNMLTDDNADSHYSYAVTTGANAAAAYAAIGSYSSPSYSVTSANVGGTNVAQTPGWVGYNTSVNSAVSSGTGATVTSAGTVANSSTWISTNTTGGDTVGSYFTFRTSFTLTGFDLNSVNISGLWASDN